MKIQVAIGHTSCPQVFVDYLGMWDIYIINRGAKKKAKSGIIEAQTSEGKVRREAFIDYRTLKDG